jgi:hypothetical protein
MYRFLSTALLLALAACSNVDLGDIDESVNAREEMPGPGIFSDDDGESSLKWSSEEGGPEQAAATSSPTPEQTEFEQFKAWQRLRDEGADSAEYQEFQQWLEYREFKKAQ